ncbi:hypothetical protein [Campylobacter coli]
MEFSKKKIVRLSLNLTFLGALFPCVLFSADLRQRNGNVMFQEQQILRNQVIKLM